MTDAETPDAQKTGTQMTGETGETGEEYTTLLVDHAAGVTTITLNRPDQLNAFDAAMTAELNDALVRFDADDDTRAIIVTGAGRAFSAGADVSGSRPPGSDAESDTGGSPSDQPQEDRSPGAPPRLRPWELRTPIIAAINGAAVGMGITYPMMWDIRIAAEDAKLGFVFTRRGLVPEGNASWLLPRLVGAGVALELLLSGRMLDGAEAQRIGLVTRAVPRGHVLEAATELAVDIAANTAPAAVAITKKMMYRYLEDGDRWAARRQELEMFGWARQQPDAIEGVKAFLEKRPPDWSGVSVDDLPEGWR